jgi:SNF2 family DNA or RNA helicase
MIEQSSKLMFVMELLEELKRGSHRVLIFSHSTKILDIIQEVLIEKVIPPLLHILFLTFCSSYENIEIAIFH